MIPPILNRINAIHSASLDIADFVMSMPRSIQNDRVMKDLNSLVKIQLLLD
jgi:hypothetical protein